MTDLTAALSRKSTETRPVIVMPIHDPTGVMFSHLEKITPALQELCASVFLGVTAATATMQPGWLAWLEAQSFYRCFVHRAAVPVGEQFRELYRSAADAYPPEQILHLCFVDRLAFALQSEHRLSFVADMGAVTPDRTPLLFQRSDMAWATHPANYRELEGMITTVGRLLFGKALDFAWCHLAVQAGLLREIMPHVRNRDLSMLAEMVLLLRSTLKTREVDWLAWEDPFIEARPADALKREREESRQEAQKRLGYVVPSLQLLWAAGK
jgi:hypothetical protein